MAKKNGKRQSENGDHGTDTPTTTKIKPGLESPNPVDRDGWPTVEEIEQDPTNLVIACVGPIVGVFFDAESDLGWCNPNLYDGYQNRMIANSGGFKGRTMDRDGNPLPVRMNLLVIPREPDRRFKLRDGVFYDSDGREIGPQKKRTRS